MALLYPIVAAQTDAKSPVDEQLMDDIRLNLEDLDSRLTLQGIFDYQFKLNGNLSKIPSTKFLRIDGVLISKAATFQQCRAYLEEPGDGGTLEVDIRRVSRPDVSITALTRQFSSSINSIARAGASIATQSVTRSTAQISTQGVTQWKSAINVSSVVPIGDDLFRYNLASATDSDWKVGDSVTFQSMASAANDGTFTIVRINDDGDSNVIIENVSGVAQAGTAGTARLNAWAYLYTNPVSTQFAAGEKADFAGHADAGNNGKFLIYAINQSGNNIIVKNSLGVANASVGGTADVLRWIYAFLSAASSDYVVGEKAETASHTSGANDGKFPITGVNFGGNNVVLYNENGVVQGGVAGNVNTLRWIYFFSVDPSANVTASDSVIFKNTSNAANSGTFVVKQVNRLTADNIVIFNENGVVQGGAFGTAEHIRMLVKFLTDQSADITTDSKIHIFGSAEGATDGDFQVFEVNRGGGANYNAVIETEEGVAQVGASGRVVYETKSLFDTTPSFVIPARNTNFDNTHLLVSSNAVFNATRKIVPSDTLIVMDILQIPNGDAKNLVVQLL